MNGRWMCGAAAGLAAFVAAAIPVTSQGAEDLRLTYDAAGRLIAERYQGAGRAGYTYDAAGNLPRIATASADGAADLAVSIAAVPPAPANGQPVEFTVTVTNRGPSAAGDAHVTFTPDSLTIESFVPSQGDWRWQGVAVVADLGLLPANAAATLSVRGVPSRSGSLTHVALAAQAGDPVPGNDAATNVLAVASAANLSVTQIPFPSMVSSNSPLTFTVTLANAGPDPAVSSLLTNHLPAGLGVVTARVSRGTAVVDAGRVVWSAGDLTAGGSATLEVVTRAAVAGWITNRAAAGSASADLAPDNNASVAAVRTLDVSYWVTTTNDTGVGALRTAVAFNVIADPAKLYVIAFNIPGDGVPRFALTSGPLTNVWRAGMMVDGWSHPSGRVEIDGSALAGSGNGFTLGSTNCTLRGLVIHSFPGHGVWCARNDLTVQDCRIGTDVAGLVARPNGGCGIVLAAGTNALVGGAGPGQGNLISGNAGDGVLAMSTGRYHRILGNLIGTDVTGTRALGNGGAGVSVQESLGTRIGGPAAGEGSTIAFNAGDGVAVTGPTSSSSAFAAIRANSLHSNAGEGIDLKQDGPTTNDATDADIGPNYVRNYPVLTNITSQSGTVRIEGTVRGTAASMLSVDVFADSTGDTGGLGEGAAWLGSADLTLYSGNTAAFAIDVTTALPSNALVTSTATDSTGSTSEFSPGAVAGTDSDLMPDAWELRYGLNPRSAADAAGDADGDGATNLAEYLDRTDPTNASSRASAPSIALAPAGSPVTTVPPWLVSATITDNVSVVSATLGWRRNGGEWTNRAMAVEAGTTYTQSISLATVQDGDVIDYMVTAVDLAGLTATNGPHSFTLAYPWIEVRPAAWNAVVAPADTALRAFVVTNRGSVALRWSLTVVSDVLTTQWIESVESGEGGWTHGGTLDLWNVTTNRSLSTDHAWWAGNPGTLQYTNSMNAWLLSPQLIPGTNGLFHLPYWMGIELGWDGGLVEISTNDGASFFSLTPTNGYPALCNGTANPAFPSGTRVLGVTGEWSRAVFDMSPWAGTPVRLRLRFGSDDSVMREGWYVDDLMLTVPAPVPWMSADVSGGTLPPFAGTTVVARIDAAGLAQGADRQAVARFLSVDPLRSRTEAPVRLWVEPPAGDADGDGLPNDWEVGFFASLTGALASAHGDGDPLDNLSEYVADTDPTNAASFFRIRAVSNLPPLRVYFDASASRRYGLESAASLTGAPWNAVEGQTNIPGTGGTMWLSDPPPGATTRFHRVRVALPP